MNTIHANSYPLATSERAKSARDILEKKIVDGRVKAMKVFNHVNENIPADAIVGSHGMNFTTGIGHPLMVQWGSGGMARKIHRNALGQMATRVGIPGAYLAELAGSEDEWKKNLGVEVLNQHFRNLNPSRNLVRSVGGEVRGFLSDRFRRLNTGPLVTAFGDTCKELGAMPYDGTATDTRMSLKALLPYVFEPVPGEALAFGIEQFNSDFGCGRYGLRGFILRLWCLNGATMEDELAQIHLGGKLSDNIEFSEKTYALDTELTVSATTDTVRGVLGPDKVRMMMNTITSANEKQINWKNVSSKLAKALLKSEYKLVQDAFESEDVINLPAGQTMWRASNAISWIAGTTEDDDRKLELQRLAGAILSGSTVEEIAA